MIPTLVDQSKRRAEEARRRLQMVVHEAKPEQPQTLPGGFAVAVLVWITIGCAAGAVLVWPLGRWAGWW